MTHPYSSLLQHTRTAAITLAVLVGLMGGLVASLWFASLLLYVSLRINPLHAGLWGWLDTTLAWRHGVMPSLGGKLAGAAIFGVLLSFGGPVFALHALRASVNRRRLYGSARFASESEIRQAGLL